jgi:hypothetical protein
MSENELRSDSSSKDVSVRQIQSEIKKDKKKFSILIVTANNDAKVDIEGKANNNSINNNLITFSKNGKNKKNLKNVLKDINSDLEGIQNDLRKSLKSFNPKTKDPTSFRGKYHYQPETQSYRKNNQSNNQLRAPVQQSYEYANPQKNHFTYDDKNEKIYILVKENHKLKKYNQKLENELDDYKKYLDNMLQEKRYWKILILGF